MSVWRRKALSLFPELKYDLHERSFSYYLLFFDLLPLAREAHLDNDQELLCKIYCFAEWCLRQPNDLGNAAAVAFYEHLFQSRKSIWHHIVPWLSPYVIKNCYVLWEYYHTPEEVKKIDKLFAARTKFFYRDCYYNTFIACAVYVFSIKMTLSVSNFSLLLLSVERPFCCII